MWLRETKESRLRKNSSKVLKRLISILEWTMKMTSTERTKL